MPRKRKEPPSKEIKVSSDVPPVIPSGSSVASLTSHMEGLRAAEMDLDLESSDEYVGVPGSTNWPDPKTDNTVEPSGSGTKDDTITTPKRKRKRGRKGKGKGKADGSKPDRQARSYVVSEEDMNLYVRAHKVSDQMFSHYLSKRIGFESSKVKRRLSRNEVKNYSHLFVLYVWNFLHQ